MPKRRLVGGGITAATSRVSNIPYERKNLAQSMGILHKSEKSSNFHLTNEPRGGIIKVQKQKGIDFK
jgi:hypothetical protein